MLSGRQQATGVRILKHPSYTFGLLWWVPGGRVYALFINLTFSSLGICTTIYNWRLTSQHVSLRKGGKQTAVRKESQGCLCFLDARERMCHEAVCPTSLCVLKVLPFILTVELQLTCMAWLNSCWFPLRANTIFLSQGMGFHIFHSMGS